jgi:hypothetical protein
MADPTGEADKGTLRLDFDRRLMLQFRGSAITSDAGLLPYRELDDALSLTDTGAETLADVRTGKNGRHRLAGLGAVHPILIKIGAKVVSHGRYVTFQLAEVAVSRQMFAEILSLIARLRAPPAPA